MAVTTNAFATGLGGGGGGGGGGGYEREWGYCSASVANGDA